MHPTFADLALADWNDVDSVAKFSAEAFAAFDEDPDLLPRMLRSLRTDQHLRPMCESYDFMDKLVIHDDRESNIRIRVHLFRPGYFDRPHNHRWTFATKILSGSYVHRLYGRDDQLLEGADSDALEPLVQRVEGEGASYVLHHNSVHAVQADAGTASLLVRGPAAKDRLLFVDRAKRTSYWVYGAEHETPEQRRDKSMTDDQLDGAITRALALVGR
ncbi:hypothetical protein [Streptomyces sp. NBC_00158]|uniref:hypothetical protein n=1 Tax=Streptomyces sp. NBC_00158 TaxID=2903627 RepID=UPI00325212B6